jgi:hypothetical protein
MTAAEIIRFPPRRRTVGFIVPDDDDGAWLVLAGSHGWLHGSLGEAIADARAIAAGFGVAVRVAA